MVIDPEIPDAGEYRGLEGIRPYTIGFLQAWETLTIAPKSIEDLGDKILVEVEQTGVGRDSGVPVTLNYFHLWTLRDGLWSGSIRSCARRAPEAAGVQRPEP